MAEIEEKSENVENVENVENCKYRDPDNMEEIIERVKNTEKHNDVVDIINKVFPGWILGWPKKYSKDYIHFQNNWEFVCKKTNSSPLRVVIVDKIVFDDPNYKLVRMFCELLTLCGHSVRRKEEFIGCKVCGDAIPTHEIYKQLVDRKINVPSFWNLKCVDC